MWGEWTHIDRKTPQLATTAHEIECIHVILGPTDVCRESSAPSNELQGWGRGRLRNWVGARDAAWKKCRINRSDLTIVDEAKVCVGGGKGVVVNSFSDLEVFGCVTCHIA